MKTIEERAKAFCEKNICVYCGDRKNCDRKCLGTCIPTYDPLEWLTIPVIDKICEWMFDYRGLIDAGLAVSVHDLKRNLYEK